MTADPTLRRFAIATMVCVSLAALAVGWSANYHVVANHPNVNVFVINTLTGKRTFCGPSWCRDLPRS